VAKRNTYSDSLLQGLENLVGGSSREMAETYKRTSDYCDAISRAMVSSNSKHVKRMAVNSATTVDDLIESMDKGIEESAKKASNHIEEVQNHLEKAKKKNRQGTGGESLFDSLIGGAKAKGKLVSHEVVESIVDIGRELGKLAPAITVFGSLALFAKSLVERIFELDKASVNLALSFGGNIKASQDYLEQLNESVIVTRISKERLLELGNAFSQAGIPIIGNTKGLKEYLEVAGNLNRVTGTSFDALARYTRSLKQNGMSAEEVFHTYDELYQSMQKYQLTLGDLNASMSEGDALWSSFGAISGKTMDQVQKDILDTKGVFRAFNIDIKNTGSLLAGIWGDPKVQRRQAGLIASMMGMKGSEAHNELLLNPKQGMQDLAVSAIKFMSKFSALRMGEGVDELQNLGSDQLSGVLQARQAMLQNMSKQMSIPQDMLSQAMSDFTSFKKTNPNNSIDDWSGKRLLESTLPGKPGGLDNALQTLNNSIDGTMSNLNNRFDAVIDNVAMLVTKQIPDIMSGINSLVDIGSNLLKNFSAEDALHNLGKSAGEFARKAAAGIPNFALPRNGNSLEHRGMPPLANNVIPFRGSHHGAAFDEKVKNIASQLQMDPAHLMAVMRFESGVDPTKRNRAGSGATGLIQFMPNTAKKLGTSTDALARMSAFDQLDYVHKYLKPHSGKMKSMQDAYLAVFSPAFMGKSPSTSMYSKGTIAYAQNKGLDIDKDGHITIAEATRMVSRQLSKGKGSPKHDSHHESKVVKELKKQNETLEALLDSHNQHVEKSQKRLDELQLRSMVSGNNNDLHKMYLHNSVA
jgi:ElaB/YqjD/DUF883 family membrane-anchored ribosome-binding protein